MNKPKPKEVYVWVARDNNLYSSDISIFTRKPFKDCDPHGVSFDGYVHISNIAKRLKIKAGECRKFKLVEVKES